MTRRLSDITARPVSLASLLDGMEAGTVVLPDFQRDFDWNPAEVMSLVATLLCGWPAGSLLLMRGKPAFFLTRTFEHAPRTSRPTEYVVLDGQQRLTALYLALRDRGPNVYALAYDDELLRGDEIGAESLEERMRKYDRSAWEYDYPTSRQISERLVPLSALSSAPDFFEWRDSLVDVAPKSLKGSLSDDLSHLYRRVLGTINHYDFPSVVLEPDLQTEAVARIFERINRSGRRLNTFDLLVARAYAPDWNLRERWESATQEYRRLEAFIGDDGLPLLQLISLHDRSDVRQPALLGLSPSRVREAWDGSVMAMDRAVAAAEGFGVTRPEWLPYPAQLLTLGGLAWESGTDPTSPLVERWFWASALGTSYDVGSSTRVVTDLRTVRAALDGQGEIDRPFVSIDSLVSATRRRSPATWRTFMALLSRAGAADPLTGEVTTYDNPGVGVSVFPRSRTTGESFHLRIFGLFRASRETARLLKDRGLPQMLAEAMSSEAEINDRLATQFLPPLRELNALMADPIGLLEERVQLAVQFLRNALADDLIRLGRSDE